MQSCGDATGHDRDGFFDKLDLAELFPMGEQQNIGLVFRHILLVRRDAQVGNRAGVLPRHREALSAKLP